MQRDWKFIAAIAAITAVAVIRVASTHRVFSAVVDEPAHLAAGYLWFDGEYTSDPSPPLPAILGALPLRIANLPRPTQSDMVQFGIDLLYSGDRYEKTLARARIGNLFLLIVAIVATAAWARRVFGRGVAILAAAALSTLPPVLGHAGLVTTDLALLASVALALLALDRFIADPTVQSGAILGAAIGIGLLSKMSFVLYFPACAAFALLARRPAGVRWRPAMAIVAAAFMVTWAGYRFDFRTARDCIGDQAVHVFDVAAPEPLRPAARWIAANLPMPAPAFAAGFAAVKAHDQAGHLSYLFGEYSRTGWWYYFPVVFFYKTPLPFLILALWGAIAIALRGTAAQRAVPMMAVAVMAIAMTSTINIGVRHILPIYVPLAVVFAHGVVIAWTRATDAFGRVALLSLLLWLFGGVAMSHPDYLAWFNEAAQPNPAQIANDSNLDWGQDGLRLTRVLRDLGVEKPYADILGTLRLERHGLQPLMFDPNIPLKGWFAISETTLAMKKRDGHYGWLSSYRPVRRIGNSIRLYHLPQ